MRASWLVIACACACKPAASDAVGSPGAEDSADSGALDSGMPDLPPELQALDPSACAAPFQAGPWVRAALPSTTDPLFDRIFPLYAMIESSPVLSGRFSEDSTLSTQAESARQTLADAGACDGDATCVRTAIFPSEATRKAWRDAAREALLPAAKELRSIGWFIQWNDAEDRAFIDTIWDDNLARAVELIDDEFLGRSPAEIDATLDEVAATLPSDSNVYAPLARLAIASLRLDGRDEAARYEPLATGENAAALAALPSIAWDRYRFAAIVIPGQGPTDLDTPINPMSEKRADIAVVRWRAGLAPFLYPSGGHVHPDRTPYSEAVEIKRYLMDTHGVPESAILIDPYARHTTTNLRNTTRTLLEAGFPPDKPVLVTSDPIQSVYIADLLSDRCMDELGYLPWARNEAMTNTDTCLAMTPSVLFRDGRDPLDP